MEQKYRDSLSASFPTMFSELKHWGCRGWDVSCSMNSREVFRYQIAVGDDGRATRLLEEQKN